MRIIIAVVIFALSACAVSSAEQIFDSESMMLEVSSSIKMMKKGGATEADCKDLAKTSCKEVETEVSNNQKALNNLLSGAKCRYLGQKEIRKTQVEYKRVHKIHHSWRIKVHQASRASVRIQSRSYGSLRNRKCGFVFTSHWYRTARHRFQTSRRYELSWRGRRSEAIKAIRRAKIAATRAVFKCSCNAKSVRDSVWRRVTRRSILTRQAKAHAKCKMMTCVLNGINIKSSQCRGSLKRLVNKRLARDVERVKCGSHKIHPVHRILDGSRRHYKIHKIHKIHKIRPIRHRLVGGSDKHGCNGSLPPRHATKWDPKKKRCVKMFPSKRIVKKKIVVKKVKKTKKKVVDVSSPTHATCKKFKASCHKRVKEEEEMGMDLEEELIAKPEAEAAKKTELVQTAEKSSTKAGWWRRRRRRRYIRRRRWWGSAGERGAKVRAERVNKGRARERGAKHRERVHKNERRNKANERNHKERAAKNRERAGKRERSAKHRARAERSNKERGSKNAERSNKRRVHAERSNKARARAERAHKAHARERRNKAAARVRAERAGKAARVARERRNKAMRRHAARVAAYRRALAIAREKKAKKVVRERRAKEQRARNIAMERRRKVKAAKAAAEKNAKVVLKKAMRIANMRRARERSAKRIAHERRRKVQRRALKAKETAHKAKIKQMKIAAAKLAKFRRVQKCIAVGMAKARARHAKMANKCMRI